MGDFLRGLSRQRQVGKKGLLKIRRVLAGIARGNHIFARTGQHHEFVTGGTTDGTCIRLNGATGQPTTREDPLIGLVHVLVFMIEVFGREVKRIRVLHQKFATAHEAKTGTDLITKFCLNLIQGDRQRFVRLDGLFDQIAHHFLVSRTKTILVLMPIFDAQELGTILEPPFALLPKFSGNQMRHKHLETARAIHFFANNLFDLPEAFEAQG
ncbi:MAG: hypothetical protein ACD_62C00377G0003 [uncultured bacterium]|nr:MAG: hypothetical protein ACD_62C00377G0003 [uncultured bacterium]